MLCRGFHNELYTACPLSLHFRREGSPEDNDGVDFNFLDLGCNVWAGLNGSGHAFS